MLRLLEDIGLTQLSADPNNLNKERLRRELGDMAAVLGRWAQERVPKEQVLTEVRERIMF